MTESRTFTLTNPEDPTEKVICDILVEFRSTVTNKRYILFSEQGMESNGRMPVQACAIDRSVNPPKLEALTTDFEWEMMEVVLSEYQKEMRERIDAE